MFELLKSKLIQLLIRLRIMPVLIWFDDLSNSFGAIITKVVGTMYCAYLFMWLASTGYHTAMQPGGGGFTQWFSQEFLQLVLLSVIMVGQDVISKKQAAAEKTAKEREDESNKTAQARLDAAIDSIMTQFELNQSELAELKRTHEELHNMHGESLGLQMEILNRLNTNKEVLEET